MTLAQWKNLPHRLLLALALPLSGCGDDIEAVTPPSPFHGIHGIAFDANGHLLAGSVVGRTIYRVDVESGASRVFVPPPKGMADDIALGPDGEIAWTAFLEGKIYKMTPDGAISLLARNLPGINSIAYAPDGRLFATQVFLGDALYEIDRQGKRRPRIIRKNLGGLNGFEFGPDGRLYGPLWFKGSVVSLNVDTARLSTVATDFGTPAAVNFDPANRNHLYVVDTQKGHVVRVDIRSGRKRIIARVKPAIDNLAFSRDGRLFISNMADNAILEIDKKTGKARQVVSGALAVAGDIAFARGAEGDEIYVADAFSVRKVNPQTGKVSEIARIFATEMDYPLGVSVSKNHIVLAGPTSGAVQVLDRRTGKSLALLHGFDMPYDAVMLPGNEIAIAEYGKDRIITRWGKGWTKQRVFMTSLRGPVSLALSPKGRRLYIAEEQKGRVLEIDLRNNRRAVIADNLSQPEGMAILPDGRIAVAEVGKKRIVLLERGQDPRILARALPIGFDGPPGTAPTYLMTGVAASDDGAVYFSSDMDAAIYRIVD